MKYSLLLALCAFAVPASADVQFAAHEIAALNLAAFPGADAFCGFSSALCPNIAAFESAKASTIIKPAAKPLGGSTGLQTNADFLASVISTIGAPSNVLAYYTSQTKSFLNFSLDNVEKYISAFTTGDFSAVFSASGSAEVMAYAIDEVIEFVSADKSGVYKAGVDKVVSAIPYPSVKWNAMKVVTDVDNGITSVKAASADGVHNYVWKMSSQFVNYNNGSVITPNSTKLDITIKYPFKQTDTNVALRMVLLGASAAGATDAHVSISQQQATSGKTYLSWVGKADTALGLVNVAASASTDESATYFSKNNNMLTAVKSLAEAGGTAKAYIKVTYFSFPVTSAHEYIYWDPSIGYGQNPTAAAGLSVGIIVLIVLVALGVIGVAGVVVFRFRQRKERPNLSTGGYA